MSITFVETQMVEIAFSLAHIQMIFCGKRINAFLVLVKATLNHVCKFFLHILYIYYAVCESVWHFSVKTDQKISINYYEY